MALSSVFAHHLSSNQAKERKCTLCGAQGPRKPPRVRAARTGTSPAAFADAGFFSPPHALAKSVSEIATPVGDLRRSCQGEGGGEAQDHSAASAAVEAGELRPSCHGEGVRGESGAAATVAAAAAVGDSSGGDWEG